MTLTQDDYPDRPEEQVDNACPRCTAPMIGEPTSVATATNDGRPFYFRCTECNWKGWLSATTDGKPVWEPDTPFAAPAASIAVYLGDGWHVVERWRGPDRVYRSICGQLFFLHGPQSCSPTRTAEVTPNLWPEAEPVGRACGCYWYFREKELKP